MKTDAQLLDLADTAVAAARRYLASAEAAVRGAPSDDQRAVHGFAWLATVVEALAAAAAWARRASETGTFGPMEQLVVRIGLGEYLAQVLGGVPMSQNEYVRPAEMGLRGAAAALQGDEAVEWFLVNGNVAQARAELMGMIRDDLRPTESVGDAELDLVRGQMRNFARERIAPNAHAWHLADALIPDEVIREMAELGVFGVCIDPAFGGLGLGKLAMCIVSEELSRGWICAGSLGTRSEIAGELIGGSGTPEQKAKWLPGIAAGDILPTAVFTEPDVGSDLASVKTRAVRDAAGDWRIRGAKNWITHAGRADVMTLLVRTSDTPGHAGLSMMLAAKTRTGADGQFTDPGLSGSEIPVLGYRGMKEFALSFDDFVVDGDSLLGGAPGQGFKQLMRTFEGARIQTAARAIGVGWNAFDVALAYAVGRPQFGKPIADFARVGDKLDPDAGRAGDGPRADLRLGPGQGPRPALRHPGGHGQAAGRAGGLEQRRPLRADPRRQRLCDGV
jgi:(2S)-methylsuccinyl-CoA dehydrogenase